MSLKDILQEEIKRSNLTIKKMSQMSKDKGLPITESYISQLKNGKQTSPSDEVLRVLSEILSLSSSKLVVQNYYDKAPEEMKKFLNDIKVAFTLRDYLLKSIFNNETRENVDKELQTEIENISKSPYYDFMKEFGSEDLCKLALNVSILSSISINGMNAKDFKEKSIQNPDMSYEELMEITNTMPIKFDSAKYEMSDESMDSLIKKGEVVIIDGKIRLFNKGDIVLVHLKKEQTMIIRKYQMLNDKILLIPINDNFEIKEFIPNDIQIYGKVTKIVKTI